MIRFTCAGLCLLLAFVVAPAHAQDADEPATFAAFEAATDPADTDAVKRARAALEAADPAFWHDLHPPGPFRTALARSFAPDDVRQRLDAAAADADAMSTTVWNLVSRHDLGALLAEVGRIRPLVEEHHYLLRDLAIEDLWEGRRELGTRLLGTVETAERAAGTFAHCAAPEAIRLVADVITGAVPVRSAALAEMARADPTTTKPRHHKPLGAERVSALLDVARTHDDHLLRMLAARVLELATDADTAAVAAWTVVRSVEEPDHAWWMLARHAPQPVPIEDVPEHSVLAALVGEMAFGYVHAEDDFAAAEAAAQRIAAVYERAVEPRTRAGLLVNFEYLGEKLVVAEFRQHPVPAWRAFLESLCTPREEDPPLIRELSRRIATRLLVGLDHEAVPDRGNRARKSPLPRQKPRLAPADWAAAVVSAAGDPAALLDLTEIYEKKGLELPDPDAEVPAPTEKAQTVLRDLVDASPDSRVARLAAELLIRSARIDDLEFVLRRADRMAFDEAERALWYPDFVALFSPDEEGLAISDEACKRLLGLVSEEGLSPLLRSAILSEARTSTPEVASAEFHAWLTTWFETVAPHLDGGLPEVALDWAIVDAWSREVDEAEGHAELAARIRAAIEKVPAEGPRLRLLHLLDHGE